jgi:hypothetical protein
MLRNSTLFALICAFSTLALAQPQSQPDVNKEPPPPSTVCAYPYSSGSQLTETQYCLSVNGNIVQFSRPANAEYIRKGAIIEGYGVCDLTDSQSYQSYYDYAAKNSGNWEETTGSAPKPTTRTFVRTTSDGVWQLTESILQGKASASRPGTIQVTMSLKNLSGTRRYVTLVRLADVNLGQQFDNDIFASTPETASVQDSFQDWGLAVTGNTLNNNIARWPITRPAHGGVKDPLDPCNTDSYGHFVGDGLMGHEYANTLAAGSTMKVTMTYRPI